MRRHVRQCRSFANRPEKRNSYDNNTAHDNGPFAPGLGGQRSNALAGLANPLLHLWHLAVCLGGGWRSVGCRVDWKAAAHEVPKMPQAQTCRSRMETKRCRTRQSERRLVRHPLIFSLTSKKTLTETPRHGDRRNRNRFGQKTSVSL